MLIYFKQGNGVFLGQTIQVFYNLTSPRRLDINGNIDKVIILYWNWKKAGSFIKYHTASQFAYNAVYLILGTVVLTYV